MTNSEIATLAGGCFWCLEAVYEQLRGVKTVKSGFAGGHLPNATYEQVCNGDSGHAEVVQIAFDPAQISYRDLLEVFFLIHDPTTLNRQGADVGEQYRSAIFFHDAGQRETAEAMRAAVDGSGIWSRPLVTEIAPFDAFIVADAHHQGYYRAHQGSSYCQIVIEPKVAKARKAFVSRLKAHVT